MDRLDVVRADLLQVDLLGDARGLLGDRVLGRLVSILTLGFSVNKCNFKLSSPVLS